MAAEEASGWHQLDGQVCLEMDDGTMQFISWGNEPIQYSIQVQHKSFFREGALGKKIDMSSHKYWTELVGKSVNFSYLDNEHQVLKVSSKENEIFLSSQYDDGTFQGDCVRVSPVCEFNSSLNRDGNKPAAL